MDGNLKRIFTILFLSFICILMYPDKERCVNEKFMDSEVIIKFTKFTSFDDYYVHDSSTLGNQCACI